MTSTQGCGGDGMEVELESKDDVGVVVNGAKCNPEMETIGRSLDGTFMVSKTGYEK
jgi:hypothetical protein